MAGRIAQIAKTALGWILIGAGLAALILPGPGLLMLLAGLVLLSQRYEWARRRVEPVRVAAVDAAARGVQDWRRLLATSLGLLALVGVGAVWLIRPAEPHWWPLEAKWWLPGGWAPGVTLIISGLVGLALLVYSYRRFR